MMINHKPQLKEGVSYLKQVREAVKLSQEDLARKIGVTSKTVYRWEAGKFAVHLTASQWKTLHKEIFEPLNIGIYDIPDDLGAPYVEAA